MPDVRLASIGRAVPAARYTQRQLYEHRPWPATPLLDRLFVDSPIQARSLFVPPQWYREPRTLTDTNRAWREGAQLLGGQALRDALRTAHVDAEAVDMLGVTTVTGYATPGLDLLLAHQEGLRNNIARAHFNCIGCHAAVPLMRVAANHAQAHPGSYTVALAVEICSACFQAETAADNLVALALFADGAAAAVLSTVAEGPRIVGFGSGYDYDHIDDLGFDLTTSGFRIVLDPSILATVGRAVGGVVEELLEAHGVRREQVSTWCFHPGGSRILDAVQRAMGLDDAAMLASRRVLRAYGNMSSPSVLFVLAEALRDQRPATGTYAVAAAFGPGLGIEAVLLAL